MVFSSRVAEGALDLGICSPPAAQLGLLFEPLFAEQMALLVPQEHPLARAETITPSDLTSQRLLLTEQHCAYREVTEKALLRRGANPYSGIRDWQHGRDQARGPERVRRRFSTSIDCLAATQRHPPARS